MEVTTQLYLGDAGDRCDHPNAAVELPRLRVVVDVAGCDGWADLVLHWTGARWEHCDEPDWSVHGLVADEEVNEAGERGVEDGERGSRARTGGRGTERSSRRHCR